MRFERKVAVLSEGCAANFGDGEEIGERFAREGFSVSFEMPSETPDAIVLNACTVKGITSATKLAKKIRSQFENVPVWVTGCATDDLKRALSKLFPDFCFGPKDAHKNEKAFQEFANKLNIQETKVQNIPELSSHTGIGIVNIEEGCLDSCTYCSTHLVKGILHSATPDSIIRRVKRKVEAGAKEIFLTGQDTSCYGFDIKTNLAELLQRIIVHVPGDYKIRLGMGNPRHALRYLDDLLDTFEDAHLYKFIHIPVQSGSDKILKAMNRRHTHKEYLQIAEAFKMRFPDLTLGTDIIVAFPGETREDFEESVRLVKETRPSICNITRFVPREGTPAFALKNGTGFDVVYYLRAVYGTSPLQDFYCNFGTLLRPSKRIILAEGRQGKSHNITRHDHTDMQYRHNGWSAMVQLFGDMRAATIHRGYWESLWGTGNMDINRQWRYQDPYNWR